jgi:GNAT superfamily N-acetyltransferase
MIELKVALEKDLESINKLAAQIWQNHYVSIIGQNQVDYMLQTMYNLESLKKQTIEQNHIFYLIFNNNELVGFLSVSTKNKNDFFLHKFYIHQSISGKGVGTKVFELLIKLISPKSLTLTVNRKNFKSINFYFKNGFTINRVEDFDIGNGYIMNDFVMLKNIIS